MINITRGENNTTVQENPNGIVDGLEKLQISNVLLNPDFSTNIYEYSAKYIGKDTKLEIETEPTDPYFSVEITGNNDLKEGENLITILVSDPDGKNVATYQITVNKSLIDEDEVAKEQEKAEKQKRIIVIGGIVVLIIFAIIISFIIKRKKDNEFAEEYTVPYCGINNNDEQENQKVDTDNLSKEDLKKKFLDNYNSYNYEDEMVEEEKIRKGRYKGKRFK